MTRHPLDPRDSVRDCEYCNGKGAHPGYIVGTASFDEPCDGDCNGRGYVVGRWGPCPSHTDCQARFIPAADQTVIEVCWVTTISDETEYYWNLNGCVPSMDDMESGKHGPFDTEDEALLTARCEVLGVDVHEENAGWRWTNADCDIGPLCPTPNDAIAAAIDAREESE